MFQGTGKGTISLTVTVIRTIVLTVPLAYLFAVVIDLGLDGVWWGMVAGNLTGSLIAFSWGRYFVHSMLSKTSALKTSVVMN